MNGQIFMIALLEPSETKKADWMRRRGAMTSNDFRELLA
jgi:hypothetical protein